MEFLANYARARKPETLSERSRDVGQVSFLLIERYVACNKNRDSAPVMRIIRLLNFKTKNTFWLGTNFKKEKHSDKTPAILSFDNPIEVTAVFEK